MNTSDSAEEFVKLYIDAIDKAIRITGVGAKNIGVMLLALTKNKQKMKGRTRLNNMLKTGKPLQIFTIKSEDLKKFSQEAKKYGILYCALADKKNSKIDGMVDIMVRDEDAPKINRIAKRFNFRSVASIERDLELEKEQKENQEEKIKTEDEKFIDDIMPVEKDNQKEMPSNDTKDTEEKNQLENSLDTKPKDKADNSKKSVKQELKEIAEELKIKEAQEKIQEKEVPSDNLIINNRTKDKKNKREEKNEVKGKHFKEPKHLDTSNQKRRRKRKKERSK